MDPQEFSRLGLVSSRSRAKRATVLNLESALKDIRMDKDENEDETVSPKEFPSDISSRTPRTVKLESAQLPKTESGDISLEASERHERIRNLGRLDSGVTSCKSEKQQDQEHEAARWKEQRKERIRNQMEKGDRAAPLSRWLPSQEVPETRLARMVLSSAFSNFCTFVILANTFLTGLETDASMKEAIVGKPPPDSFSIINKCFTYIFLLELILRIVALRWYWITSPDWRWNLFDFFLVCTAIGEELVNGLNLSFLRVLRLLRVARVARILRVVRFFRELRRMVLSITACFASLCWAFLLLFIINFIFSLVFMQGIAEFLVTEPVGSVETAQMEVWYGGLITCMFSLFLCISGGRDWWDIAHPILIVNDLYRYVFAFYVGFVVIGVLNVLTVVFLENATEFSDKDLVAQAQIMKDKTFVAEMREIFKDFDTRGNGTINYEEFRACLEREDLVCYLRGHDIGVGDAHTLFRLLVDDDDAEYIDAESFIHGCLQLKGPAKAIDVAVVLREIQDHKGEEPSFLRAALPSEEHDNDDDDDESS